MTELIAAVSENASTPLLLGLAFAAGKLWFKVKHTCEAVNKLTEKTAKIQAKVNRIFDVLSGSNYRVHDSGFQGVAERRAR